MRHQMKNSRRISTDAQTHHHKSQLAYRRIRQYPFYIVINYSDSSGKKCRNPADDATVIRAAPCEENRTKHLATRYTPAATIVAAWINAETGVGPSIASGSHTCSGNCADFPTAPQNINNAAAVNNGPVLRFPSSLK